MPCTLYLPIVEEAQAGEARRLAVAWAMEHGSSAEISAQLALVISELARNLAIHTKDGGSILVRQLETPSRGLEVMSLDRGPGMANVSVCLEDGYSTAGTSGTGLGAVRRASSLFDVHTLPGMGTALVSRFHEERLAEQRQPFGFGVVNVPKKGETVCGDSYSFQLLGEGRARLMIADGLGHGPHAADASQLAVKVFEAGTRTDLVSLMKDMNDRLRATRGAAVAIAEVDLARNVLTYCGVGNIAGRILCDGKSSHLVSVNGTVGASFPHPREFTYPWTPDSMLVMNSDGLKTQWQLDAYAGLFTRHPAVSAGILFRDFSRGTDDSTVATLRIPYDQRV